MNGTLVLSCPAFTRAPFCLVFFPDTSAASHPESVTRPWISFAPSSPPIPPPAPYHSSLFPQPSSLATVTLGAHATPQSQASHDGSGIRTAIPVAVPGPSSVSVRCASAGNLASVSERRTHAPGRQVPGAGQRAGIGIGAGVVEGQRGVTMDSVDDAAPHFEAAGLLGFDQVGAASTLRNIARWCLVLWLCRERWTPSWLLATEIAVATALPLALP